ncbi:unnamed protein product, partial [Candidula unifasciata]
MNSLNTSLLHFYADQGCVRTVKALLEAAIVDAKTNSGETALHYSVWNNHIEIVELLLQAQADVNAVSYTPLHYSAWNGHADIVRILIHWGANVNAQRNTGDTPLHYSVRRGHLEVVDLLLEAGADVNIKDE